MTYISSPKQELIVEHSPSEQQRCDVLERKLCWTQLVVDDGIASNPKNTLMLISYRRSYGLILEGEYEARGVCQRKPQPVGNGSMDPQ